MEANKVTNEQVTKAYDAAHEAFVTNAPDKYSLKDYAVSLALRFAGYGSDNNSF